MVDLSTKENKEKDELVFTDRKEIGKRIKQWRLARALTQTQLGHKVGVTFQQIQKYEAGKNGVSISRLWELAKALSVNLTVLLPEISSSNNAPTEANDSAPVTTSDDAASETNNNADGNTFSPYNMIYNAPTALHEESSFEYQDDESDAESKEILGLVRQYKKIKSKESRKAVYSLIKSLSSSQD